MHPEPSSTDTPTNPTAVPRRRIVLTLIALAALAALGVLVPGARTPLFFVVGLVALVVVHEAGHFAAARACGMAATEFFVGFGPRLWSIRRGETEYGVKAILGGGYVRIVGMTSSEDVGEVPEDRTYRAASAPRRLLVVSAGVLVNLAVAWLLFSVALVAQGTPTGFSTEVAQVQAGSPAEAVGLSRGDQLVSVDGVASTDWLELRQAFRDAPGRPVEVVVESGGEQRTVVVTPATVDGVGVAGVAPAVTTEPIAPPSAVGAGAGQVWTAATGTAQGLVGLVSPSGLRNYAANFGGNPTTQQAEERPRSVIGIVDVASEVSGGDLWAMLQLLALISVVLAVFNAIPLLPFDGGHAAIVVYEAVVGAIRRRPVRVNYERLVPLTYVVLAGLLVLGLSAAVLDVGDIVSR